jgi:hypothetical protein
MQRKFKGEKINPCLSVYASVMLLPEPKVLQRSLGAFCAQYLYRDLGRCYQCRDFRL